MVDPERIRSLVAAAEVFLEDVEMLRDSVGRERFLADRTEQYRIEFPLQQCIQCCIDLAAHQVADLPGPKPASLAQLFSTLAEQSRLQADLAVRMGSMARFRNLLVHGYVRIDPELVWGILTDSSLGDLRAFLRTVAVQR